MMIITRTMVSNKEPEVSGREVEIRSHLVLLAVGDLFCELVACLTPLPIAAGSCSGYGCWLVCVRART